MVDEECAKLMRCDTNAARKETGAWATEASLGGDGEAHRANTMNRGWQGYSSAPSKKAAPNATPPEAVEEGTTQWARLPNARGEDQAEKILAEIEEVDIEADDPVMPMPPMEPRRNRASCTYI